MRVGLFRRMWSYFLDFIPIIALLSIFLNLFVGQILQPEGYEYANSEYQRIESEYSDRIRVFEEQWENGEITEEEFLEEYNNHLLYLNLKTKDHTPIIFMYYLNVLFYFVVSFNTIYYFYNGFTKGKTLGRRIAKIELTGKVNWWTLFVREVVWKFGYWVVLLGIGGILLDVAMIGLGAKKMAPRDYITGIKLGYEGVQYPF